MPKRWVASAGIGVGVNGLYGAESPPLLSVSGEYGVNKNVSVGALIGRASATERTAFFDEAIEWRFGYTLIAARASYHLREVAKNDRLDPYIGAAVGYNRVSVEAKGSFISSEPFGADSYALYGAYAGARYLLNERVAGFVELGFGISQLSAGLSMRL